MLPKVDIKLSHLQLLADQHQWTLLERFLRSEEIVLVTSSDTLDLVFVKNESEVQVTFECTDSPETEICITEVSLVESETPVDPADSDGAWRIANMITERDGFSSDAYHTTLNVVDLYSVHAEKAKDRNFHVSLEAGGAMIALFEMVMDSLEEFIPSEITS